MSLWGSPRPRVQSEKAEPGLGVEACLAAQLCAVWPSERCALSVPVSLVSPLPRPPPQELIRLLAVILLVGVPIVSVLVLLGEVGLRAQRRQ